MSRLWRWVLRHDPTSACEWTQEDADETAVKLAAEVFANARLRARVAELEALTVELEQENTRLHLELTEAQIAGGKILPFPSLPMKARESWPVVARAVEAEATPVHDGLAVDVFMEQVDRWGNEVDQ